ncbi:MAG: DUF1405 domain-containing protein [Peptococcaceae bacterium]|nr:DUF1405 domain-containing protein [Peptococcaceae bacterium]
MEHFRHSLLRFILKNHIIFFAVLLINVAGSIYGFYWYRNQLAATPWHLWIFTPECPIQTLLFSLVLLLRLRGITSLFLEAVTFLGLIKYGSWTVLILGYHALTGGNLTPEQIALVVGHAGMVLQGWVFLSLLTPARWMVFLFPAWFAFNDFLDYVVGIHPYLPNPGHVPQAALLAGLGTAYVLLYSVLMYRKAGYNVKGIVPKDVYLINLFGRKGKL